jgi:hypothetical protein
MATAWPASWKSKCGVETTNGGPVTQASRYIMLFQVFQVETGNGNNHGKFLKCELLGQLPGGRICGVKQKR